MNTSFAKVYPGYIYENKMEVSMHDRSSSTNVIDSSAIILHTSKVCIMLINVKMQTIVSILTL